MDQGYYILTLYGIIISVITSFIYLRLIKLIWFDEFYVKSKDDSLTFYASFRKYNLTLTIILMLYTIYIVSFMFMPDLYFDILSQACISLVKPY